MKLISSAGVIIALSGLGGILGIETQRRDLVSVSRVLNPVCKGSVLESTKKLYPNEYICTTEDKERYLFGLDSHGLLHEIHFDAEGTMSVYWSSQKQGSYLRMQKDGNLVLRNSNRKAVWSSSCYGAGSELTFHPLYPGIGARTYVPGSAPDESIWSVASWAENGLCSPPVKCMGRVLEPGQFLRRDEYLCVGPDDDNDDNDEDWNRSYRFGVGNNGRLALFWRDEPIWSPNDTTGSHELRMQTGGNLVLRDEAGNAIWASKCKSNGNAVEMTSRGVLMNDENGDTSWYVDYDGEESDCFPSRIPPDLCVEVSTKSGSNKCRVRMRDDLNIIYTTLQVEEVGPNKYVVTDNIQSWCFEKGPWNVDVKKLKSGALVIDAGVPEVTCKELMDGWPMRDDRQLTFTPDTYRNEPEEYPCTDFGKNLIYFMIQEWYYFG